MSRRTAAVASTCAQALLGHGKQVRALPHLVLRNSATTPRLITLITRIASAHGHQTGQAVSMIHKTLQAV